MKRLLKRGMKGHITGGIEKLETGERIHCTTEAEVFALLEMPDREPRERR